jgi:hypothetical protein
MNNILDTSWEELVHVHNGLQASPTERCSLVEAGEGLTVDEYCDMVVFFGQYIRLFFQPLCVSNSSKIHKLYSCS